MDDLGPRISCIFVLGDINDLIAITRPSAIGTERVANVEIQAFPIARATVRVEGREIKRPGATSFDRVVNQAPGGSRDAAFEIAVLDKNGQACRFTVFYGQELKRALARTLAGNSHVAPVRRPI